MPLWTPERIDTSLWLDAADSSTVTANESGRVGEWQDKSGNDRHASTTLGTSARPIVLDGTLNSLDEIEFNGSNQQLYLPVGNHLAFTENMSFFAVFRRGASANVSTLGAGSGQLAHSTVLFLENMFVAGFAASTFVNFGTVTTHGAMMAAVVRNSTHLTAYINGSDVDGEKSIGAVGTTTVHMVGRSSDVYHSGTIAEIIAVEETLSNEDRQKIEGYLAHKWGIEDTLPAEHPYKDAAPAIILPPLADGIPGAEGTLFVRAFNNWATALDPLTTQAYYAMELVKEGESLRIPISSWQATLQLNSASYLQCVVPAAAAWASDIFEYKESDGQIVIYRGVRFEDGTSQESEMARAPMQVIRMDEGPTRSTITLSGYSQMDAPALSPVRVLRNIRSRSSGSGLRVRSDIDWFLRPGMQAQDGATVFTVSWMNLYVTENDQYMDVGGA